MAFSPLPLSYCTNVHPGLTVAEVRTGLQQFTAPTRRQFGPLAAGLWLAQPVIAECHQVPEHLSDLRQDLRDAGLSCYTLNTFPFGNFHEARVKEKVYLPDWTRPDRYDYTLACAGILAQLMSDEAQEGSLSTVPLGFKPLASGVEFENACAHRLIELAQFLSSLFDRTGKRIRLAIEPEPFCVLETTPEVLMFFQRMRELAVARGLLDAVNEYIGVCYDVCHQAVEFEGVAASVRQIDAAGIRINKVHITCAIRLESPMSNLEARESLARYAEPRYLHQTTARRSDGTVLREMDLTPEFVQYPPAEFADADEWRVHFHVPVNADRLGPLQTTRPDLRRALQAVRDLPYAPHLEVETYTWEVLPDGQKPDLVSGLLAELVATEKLITEIENQFSSCPN